jgi:hypothetical protein
VSVRERERERERSFIDNHKVTERGKARASERGVYTHSLSHAEEPALGAHKKRSTDLHNPQCLGCRASGLGALMELGLGTGLG